MCTGYRLGQDDGSLYFWVMTKATVSVSNLNHIIFAPEGEGGLRFYNSESFEHLDLVEMGGRGGEGRVNCG